MFTEEINSLPTSELVALLSKNTKELLDTMDRKGTNFIMMYDMCLELKLIQTAIEAHLSK